MNAGRNSLRADSDIRICILKQNSVAHKLLLGLGCNGVSKGDEQKVLRLGLLAKIMPYQLGSGDVAVQSVQSEAGPSELNDIWVVNKMEILPVKLALVPALQNLSPNLRVQLVGNAFLSNELAKIEVGSKVFLSPGKDGFGETELATVKYIGPIHNMGPAFFYGLSLTHGSKHGDCDGSFYGTRYFSCPEKCGTFVSIDQLLPYIEPTTSPPMPSHGDSKDPGNFKSTVILHLKEKENMSRSQTSKVERTEKLIDLEVPFECPLRLKDRVVWVRDESGPEPGTVRWIGHLEGHQSMGIQVGVEFDNSVGSGSGMIGGKRLFQTKIGHALFLPIAALIKFEDFYEKPAESVQNKMKNPKLIENSKSSQSLHQSIVMSSQLSNSRKYNAVSKNQHSDSVLRNSAIVELNDTCDVTDNSLMKNRYLGNREDKICRSEYVFSEQIPDFDIVTDNSIDNSNKHVTKDCHKFVGKKYEIGSNNYLTGESVQEHNINDNISNHRRRAGKSTKHSETKVRHDVVPSSAVTHNEFVDNLWSTPTVDNQHKVRVKEKLRGSVGVNGQSVKANNNDALSVLEVVGQSLHTMSFNTSSKTNDHQEPLVSPHHSSGGDSDYDIPEPVVDLTSPESPVDLGVGSVVEVSVRGEPRYGVIRWIGVVPEDIKGRKVAGIEMEQELADCNDGTFNGRRYFQCNPKRALFIGLRHCQKDRRFQDIQPNTSVNGSKSKNFGPEDSPVIPGAVRPLSATKKEDLESVCGKYRGIQGRHNSCYLDATLFSMFAFTSVFDSLLFRPRTKADHSHYEEVQRVLREEIVNPLRKNLFVRGDRVMKLRTLLENLSSVSGLTSEEKDPEEFLTSLVAQILRAKPFLKLSSGQEAYHYQLFVEKDEHLRLPTVQQLFEQSFLASDIKLKEVPSCLIIQMPRFGKSFKMYPRICPSQLLDVTDIIEDSPRQCTVCGKLAEYECKECFGNSGIGSGLESIAFCDGCLDTAHNHHRRSSHRYRRLTVPPEYAMLQDHCAIPRLYMELFAVVCIETSHYVTFVKCGSGADAPWCFFDSMADRKGEQNGYNIPEVVSCPNLTHWLSEEGAQSLSEVRDDRQLPEHAKRLYCDAYMCMYQSTDMMMYR